MQLNQEELYAALGLAMQKIEAAGASVELTQAVIVVGDVRQAVGNKWNPANEFSAQRVRNAVHDQQVAELSKASAQRKQERETDFARIDEAIATHRAAKL